MSALEINVLEPQSDSHTSSGGDAMEPGGLSLLEQAMVADTLRIAMLEAQNATLLAMVEEQNAMLTICADITVTARAFVDVLTAQHAKTGEAVFKTAHGEADDDPIVQTLNFRFSDLAAALNRAGRPVAPKLAQGTVH